MPRTYSMVRNNVARYLKLCEEESTITGRVGDLWSPDHEIGALSFYVALFVLEMMKHIIS